VHARRKQADAGARARACLEGQVGAHGRGEATPVERRLLQSVASVGIAGERTQRTHTARSVVFHRTPQRTEKEASATPPTMGASVASMAAEGTEPRNAQDSNTEKNGSIACAANNACVHKRTLSD
jgi:hypothetical protein